MRARRWRRSLFIGFMVAVTAWSAWRVLRHTLEDQVSGRITLRFSHWQLESGVREAFDQLVQDYEALHPGIRIEQLPIPGRIYRQWTSTQLVGGSAPDLVQIGLGVGGPQLVYFRPITTEVNKPNPYNQGTALEGLPWRNTFNDGMETSYDQETFECYGASLFTGTIRIYCNLDLLHKITGREHLPENFAELQTLCATVRDYARRTGEEIEPIAGSSLTAILMFDDLLRAQTQRLASKLNPGTGLPSPALIEDFYLPYLNGDWTVDGPTLQAVADLWREAGQLLPPGFAQIEHDQAHFRFVQKRALLLMGFSGQATGIFDRIKFRTGVFRSPQPDHAEPRFGAGMVARSSEGSLRSYGSFGITKASRHSEIALDFLHFLTSEKSARKFTTISRFLPTVVGVEPSADMLPFMPDLHGYPMGPGFNHTPDTKTVVANAQYLLFGPEGSSRKFLDRLRDKLGPAMRTDLERIIKTRLVSLRRTDTTIGATQQMRVTHPADPLLGQKLDTMLETQNELEAALYYTRLRLAQAARLTPATNP
ncbi:MAG: extracellular solute-binding protein [Cephaloticoccus sp.]|nr:extracellular solute-binding protein [Cephaloticoccus sp.]